MIGIAYRHRRKRAEKEILRKKLRLILATPQGGRKRAQRSDAPTEDAVHDHQPHFASSATTMEEGAL